MEHVKRCLTFTKNNQTDQEDQANREPNAYKRDISTAYAKFKRHGVSIDEKIKLLKKLGGLAWTGGLSASKLASKYLGDILLILDEPNAPAKLSTAVIKALVEITWHNDEIKEGLRSTHVLQKLYNILVMRDPELKELQQWAVYAMLCLATDHHHNQIELLRIEDLPHSLHEMSEQSWTGWTNNEASKLFELLGYQHKHTEGEG